MLDATHPRNEELADGSHRSRAGAIPYRAPAVQRWAEAAQASIARIEGATVGTRKRTLALCANDLDMDASYLRRGIAAFRFASSGALPSLELTTYPLAVVEALKNWAAVDLAGAETAGRTFAFGKTKITDFQASAKQAIAKRPKSRPIADRVADFRSELRSRLLESYPEHEIREGLLGIVEGYIDLVRSLPEGPADGIAIVTVDPTEDQVQELAACRVALLSALGLSVCRPHVVLACATQSAQEHAERLLGEVIIAQAFAWSPNELRKRLQIWGPRTSATIKTSTVRRVNDGGFRGGTPRAVRSLSSRQERKRAG